MTRVFVSYSNEDRDLVAPFILGLESAGLDVWWDVSIRGGDDWSASIQRELERSDCIVIFWSSHSVDSPWVRIEANHARQHNSMVPVRLDPVDLPDEYRMLQTIDAASSETAETIDKIVEAIRSISQVRRKRSSLRAAVFVMVLLAAVALYFGIPYFTASEQGADLARHETVWKQLEDASTFDHLNAVESEFKNLRDSDTGSASGHAGLCVTFLSRYQLTARDGDLAAAESSCAAAAAMDTGSAKNSEAQGWLDYYTGNHEQAIEEFTRATSMEPTNASAWRGLAESYEARGRVEEARQALVESTVVQPGSWRSQNAMALFLQRQGETQASIARFELALQLAPENISILNNLGVSKLFDGDYAGAIEAWNHVLDLTGAEEHGATLTNIGSAYYLMRDFSAAMNAFEKVTRLMGDDYRAWANLGDTARALDDIGMAHTSYTRALDRVNLVLSSNNNDVYGLASRAGFRSALKLPGWEQDLAAALELAPEDPEVRRLATLCYLRAGDIEKARAEYANCTAMGYPPFLLEADYQFDIVRE
jgi:Flp pilus assembly protein TadD